MSLDEEWSTLPRWKGIYRPYQGKDVEALRGSLQIEYTLAKKGAEKLFDLFEKEPFVRAMGALTGNQAVQQVQAGLKAIYVSGWQVAADANDALETYPDLSLYPVGSVPHLIAKINKALIRADEIQNIHHHPKIDYFVPIIADAEAGFGGPLNTFELAKAMIINGVSAIHLEDQISSFKKCGHMGGKVLAPTTLAIEKLVAARLASDILNVPTLLIGRTDAESASFISSNQDPTDHPFIEGTATSEGYFKVKKGADFAIARGRAFAPYCDLIWCETSKPDLGEAKAFARGIHECFPGKRLAYNCSPSFNWSRHLDKKELLTFQEKLSEMGYCFQFITLAGFHTLNASMFKLSSDYLSTGMGAYAAFQEEEMSLEKKGYQALKHQSFVGAGYFDSVLSLITNGCTSTHALKGSTEESQF